VFIRAVVEVMPWCDVESAENSIEKALLGLEETADVHIITNSRNGKDYIHAKAHRGKK